MLRHFLTALRKRPRKKNKQLINLSVHQKGGEGGKKRITLTLRMFELNTNNETMLCSVKQDIEY